MKVLIEFYRVRERDDTCAILGRVTCDEFDASAAIGLARSLFRTLDMPQEPDAAALSRGVDCR